MQLWFLPHLLLTGLLLLLFLLRELAVGPAYRPFLALRYLLTRPINLLGVFGVTLGVWALIMGIPRILGAVTSSLMMVRSSPDFADQAVNYATSEFASAMVERMG